MVLVGDITHGFLGVITLILTNTQREPYLLILLIKIKMNSFGRVLDLEH